MDMQRIAMIYHQRHSRLSRGYLQIRPGDHSPGMHSDKLVAALAEASKNDSNRSVLMPQMAFTHEHVLSETGIE